MFPTTPVQHPAHPCPLGSGEPCTHCVAGALDAEHCDLVHQLLEDPDLAASYRRFLASVEQQRATSLSR